jgi:hypothetical protein
MEDRAQQSTRQDHELGQPEPDPGEAAGPAETKSGPQSTIPPRPAGEIENFRKKAAESRRDLKDLRKNLRVETDTLEFWTKLFNIGLVPLLVALAGIALALGRRRQQRAATA